jgi:hypothetical protein
MPINPNDPNSVAGNPEGLAEAIAAMPQVGGDQLSVENKVRCTIVHTLTRYQPPECEATAVKLQQIWLDRHNNVTTKQQMTERLDALVAGDITTWITDPITKHFFDEAVSAMRGME